MSLSLLFPACAMLFAGYFFQHLGQARARSADSRVRGMADVVMLRRLAEALPQHRGMSNALLQGDESFRSKLSQLQSEIDVTMRSLDELTAKGDPWSLAARVAQVEDGWRFIKQQLSGFTPAESFACHTQLMTEVLYLLNDVADAAGLLVTGEDERLIDAAVNLLPLVTETLGQARGMGTGVAVRGRCATDMRVKLRYLHDNTQRVSAEVAQGVRLILQGDARLRAQAETALEDSQRATQAFLSMLESRIINARLVDIESTDFYNAGSEAIKHNFALLDAINNALMVRVQSAAQQARQRLLWARAVALTTLVPAVYLFSLLA
jgi:methyl-accepting chemotaxis protein